MTDQHASVERLAAYAAGDLDASAALEVEAHVLLCTDCRADVLAVQRVTTDLAAVPQVTMPADVAARVDAALARESAGAGDSADAGAADARLPAAPAGDVLPMVPRRRMPSFAGLAAVAAGVALVAAISVPLVTGSGGGGAADSASSAGGAAQSTVTTRRLESGLDYRASSAEAVLRDAVSGTASKVSAGAPAQEAQRDMPASPAEDAAVVSGTTETTAKLTLLETNPGRLAACVESLADSQPAVGRTPLLVDFASFEGTPALIVVFPTVTRGEVRPDRVDFWAVGPGCGTARGDDDVRHFARIARPPGL